MKIKSTAILLAFALAAGCASVDVTKTAKGYYPPTDPNNVDILSTKPDRKYIELGSINSRGWDPGDTAKMYNALRAKAAPLGADAVIILNSGMYYDANLGTRMFTTGVAIKYDAQSEAQQGVVLHAFIPTAVCLTTP